MKREILGRFLSIYIVVLAAMVLASSFHAKGDEVPPNAAAQSNQDEFISLEDGKLVAGFRAFLKAVKVQMNQSGPGIYISPFDREYYENLSTVFEKNIETLEKRKKISRKKFEEYGGEFNPHIEAYARMSMVRTPIAIYLKQMSTPGLDRGRIQKFFDRHRVNGEDAKAFYDRIAKTSRPEALELDDVELVIKVDAPREYTDFWPDRTVELDYTVSNSGPEDAENVQLDFLLSDPVNEDLRSGDMNCQNQRTSRSGSCQSDLLSEGQQKQATLVFDLNKDRLPFRLEEKYRAIVTVEATAKSADPEYETVKSISFTVRDCKRAYLYRLRKAKQLKLRKYQRSMRDVLEISNGLPGRIYYSAPDSAASILDRKKRGVLINNELQKLGREAASNKGPDGFLRRMSSSGSRLSLLKKSVEDLADNLMSETRPSRICATPEGHLARMRNGLLPIRERMLLVSNMASSAQAEAKGRMSRYKQTMASTGSGDKTETAASSAGKGLVVKASRMWANFAVQDLMTHLKFAEQSLLRTAGRAVGALGLAKSALDILVASDDLANLNVARQELGPLLGWMELSTYLTALDLRYTTIIEAHDAYFKEIEEAHEQACTCVEPF